MINLGQELWKLSTELMSPSLQDKEAEDLIKCFATAYVLKQTAERERTSPTEHRWADKLFEDVVCEIQRRGIRFIPLFVEIDNEGHFIQGREALKAFWMSIEFLEMQEIADQMMEIYPSEEQRKAIIELEQEVIYKT